MRRRWLAVLAVVLAAATAAHAAPAHKRPYRLKDTDLKQRVIWGAVCERPDGTGLAFGGQDQQADDGRPHTRIKVNGRWTCIRDDLRAATPLQKFGERAWSARDLLKRSAAYDCERNRWVSLRINYETDKRGPLAPTAVRRSVGLACDARRKLIWGVDTNRVRVFVLRFDAKGAGIEAMK